MLFTCFDSFKLHILLQDEQIITPSLQMRKRRQGEVKLLAQGHTARHGEVRMCAQAVGFHGSEDSR